MIDLPSYFLGLGTAIGGLAVGLIVSHIFIRFTEAKPIEPQLDAYDQATEKQLRRSKIALIK